MGIFWLQRIFLLFKKISLCLGEAQKSPISIIDTHKKRLQSKNKSASKCHTYLRRTADKVFDFLIARKYGQKGRQVELSFRELKAQIYWPTTDQKVRGSNPCGRTWMTFKFSSQRKVLFSF